MRCVLVVTSNITPYPCLCMSFSFVKFWFCIAWTVWALLFVCLSFCPPFSLFPHLHFFLDSSPFALRVCLHVWWSVKTIYEPSHGLIYGPVENGGLGPTSTKLWCVGTLLSELKCWLVMRLRASTKNEPRISSGCWLKHSGQLWLNMFISMLWTLLDPALIFVCLDAS